MNIKRCACIDTLYTELPFEERFQAAKNDGFEAVEFWDWRSRDLDKIRRATLDADIAVSGFNGDFEYSLIDPEHKDKYIEVLHSSLKAAEKTGASSVTIHSNGLGEGGKVIDSYDNLSDTVKICSMFRTLQECAKLAEQYQIRLNLEGLNITTDHEGNFLKSTRMAAEITRLINSPYLKILYDVYHMQLNEGSICDNIAKYIDQIGHIHVADAPGRHEPGTGEINYANVYRTLIKLGYKYRVGYELFPKTDTKTAVAAIMKD